MKILAKLLVERGVPGDSIKDPVAHRDHLSLIQGNALDAISRMLGEEVASRTPLVGMAARNGQPKNNEDAGECRKRPEQSLHPLVPNSVSMRATGVAAIFQLTR